MGNYKSIEIIISDIDGVWTDGRLKVVCSSG